VIPDLTRKLDRVFNPKVIAVVGDKKANGYSWLKSLIHFTGKLYSVQIDEKEIPGIVELGVTNVKSLMDIPEPVDFVVCAVPRKVLPRVLEDCIRKEVGGVTAFTSGFAETDEEGKRMQQQIAERATAAGLPLIGPNCMGIFRPKLGIRHGVDQYYGETGPVGVIAQSGGQATFITTGARANGLRTSKSVSFGNAAVLEAADFLEYLGQDEETKAIAMYIEGVRDGRRFFRTLRQVAPRKPVIIWRGGQTEDGARAARSHTGSLASSMAIWDAVARQCGAIRADTLDDVLDYLKAMVFIKPSTGDRVGLISMSGGQAVVTADAFARAGLRVPALTERSYAELASFFNVIGGSYRNPLDVSWNFDSTDLAGRLLGILQADENIDAVSMEFGVGAMQRRWRRDPAFAEGLLTYLVRYKEESPKPFFITLFPGKWEAEALEIREKLQERGIATYPSFQRGANAYRRLVDYYRAHAREA